MNGNTSNEPGVKLWTSADLDANTGIQNDIRADADTKI